MRKHIQMAIPKRYDELVVVDGRFVFKPNNSAVHRAVQKALLWLLKKMGCQAYDQVQSVRTTTFDFDNLFSALAEAKTSISWAYPGTDLRYLLIGPEWYRHLVGEKTEMWPMSAYIEDAYSVFDYNAGTKAVLGIEVVVIPWMTGQPLIMPRLDDIHRIV